jgi:glycosyltransferase involved in cell wall biosynthesis
MKILAISKYFPPRYGGVESVVYYNAKNLIKKGHKVTVIAFDKGPYRREKFEGVDVVRIPINFEFGAQPISFGLLTEVWKHDFDICNLHEPNPFANVVAYSMLALRRKPYVVTYHSDILLGGGKREGIQFKLLKIAYKVLERLFIFRSAKRIMPTSPQYIEMSDTLPGYRDKLEVVPNGVDLSKYTPSKDWKPNHTILFVGRLIYYKGAQYLIMAGDGEMREELETLAKKLGLEKHVNIIGKFRDDVIAEFQKCGVSVLPSIHKSEAFGIVILESMACGVPVITTDISGTVYAAGNAGIIVKPKDSKALADAIVRVITNPKLAREMREKGLAHVRNFDWKKITEKTEKIYRKALER